MKFRVPDIVLGALLTVAVFAMGMLFASSYQPSPATKDQGQQSEPAAQNRDASKPVAAEHTADSKTAQHKEEKSEFWSAKLTDWLLAVFTFFLVAFTYRLWKSTEKLWEAGNKQFELARQEFIATHRPKVIVRFVQGPFYLDDRRFIFITFVNIGDSEAIIRAIGADLAIWRIGGSDGGHWEPPGLEATPVDLDPTITLASGQRHTVKVTSRGTWGDPEIWADTHDQIQTIAQGAIEYRDLNGVVRETGFSRVLDRFGTFHASKNPEEEYQD